MDVVGDAGFCDDRALDLTAEIMVEIDGANGT